MKLIASDIDGTLLLGGAKQISGELFEQIKTLRNMGIFFMAASGRQYQNLRVLFEPVKDDIVYLSENGCLGIYQNKVIYQKELERELAFEIAENILEKENCELQISTPDIQYLIPKTEAFYQYMKNEPGITVRKVKKLSEVRGPILKVAVYNPVSDAHRKDLQDLFGRRCGIQLGRDDWTDLTPKKTDKGTALKAMIKALGLKPKDCMAFGDYYNDVSMLKAVGCSVAMKTAPEDIRNLAQMTTDTVENMLRLFIQNGGKI